MECLDFIQYIEGSGLGKDQSAYSRLAVLLFADCQPFNQNPRGGSGTGKRGGELSR